MNQHWGKPIQIGVQDGVEVSVVDQLILTGTEEGGVVEDGMSVGGLGSLG